MPTTINGIGTRYLGKDNLQTRSGTCTSCNAYGELQTYDTGLWFCLIYIPIIPLGKKRILDECPSCRRHAAVGAGEWEQIRTSAIDEAKREFEASPDDLEKAISLHATLLQVGDRDRAEQMATILQNRFSDEVDMHVYLGSCYEETNQLQQSNQCFHKAYEIAPDNHVARQVSAVAFLREDKLPEAHMRIKQAIDSGEPVDVPLTFSIASGLQAANDPTAAYELMETVAKQVPEIRKQKEFKKLAKQVEETTGAAPGTLAPRIKLTERPAFWWSLAAAAVVACLVAWDVYLTGNQPLYVVNGLPDPITVVIDDGEPITIRPNRSLQTSISNGSHTAQVSSPEAVASDLTFEIESSRVNRWFRSPVHVLDPTHSAVVLWEETVYSALPVNRDFDYEILAGRLLSSFDDVDYHFEEFPDELEVKDTTKELTKTRVGIELGITPVLLALNDPNWLNKPEAMDFIEPHLLYAKDEDADGLHGLYTSAAVEHNAVERAAEFLGKHLDRTPLDVEWHRRYQTTAEWCGQDPTERYDKLLDKSPKDADLLYLRGRLESQADRSQVYFDRALETNSKHARTLSAIAYSHLATGDFESAIKYADRSLQVDDELSDTKNSRFLAMLASGQYSKLERELEKIKQEQPTNFSNAQRLVLCQAAQENFARARSITDAYVRDMQKEWPGDPYDLAKRLELQLAIAEGQFDQAGILTRAVKDKGNRDSYQFTLALLRDDLDEAAGYIPALNQNARGAAWLWTAVCYQKNGDANKTRECITKACEYLAKSGGDEGAAARLLTADLKPDQLADELLGLSTDPTFKTALLLLSADRVGTRSAEIVKLAEKLTLIPNDYQSLVRSVLAARND